jgi:hypothetical protein
MVGAGDDPRADQERVRRLIFDTVVVRALAQVVEAAKEAGVAIAPVKGVVLARWIYADVFERPYRDLDLLISREGFSAMRSAVEARGWPMQHQSLEMGELEFTVDRVVVEVHAEFGRRDLCRLTTGEVLARARPDRGTFPFEVLRVDEIDHFFLLVANVTKKAFTYANPHQPADLERLLGRLEPRWRELADRAGAARFMSALRNVSSWMAEVHGSALFARFVHGLPRARRRPMSAAVRWHRRAAGRRSRRLESASGLLGLVLAILTPDDRLLRLKGLWRLLRRGAYRRLRRDPG